MRAIVFPEKCRVEVWSGLKPRALKDDEVRLQTVYTGVSAGTERHVMMGGPYSGRFPVIPGYQNVGRIIEIGPGVSGWNVGDIVFSDGGLPPEGWTGSSWGGHIEVRNRRPEGNFVKIPSNLALEEASLVGVMSIGMKAAKRGNVRLSDKVLVIGLGLIGQGCAQSSNAMGAEVHGVDLLPLRLEVSRKASCHEVWDGREVDVWDRIRGAGPFDVVFETTGAEGIPDLALSCIRNSTGRMVAIAGRVYMTYKNIGSGQAHEATVIHTSHFGPGDVHDVIRQVLNHRIVINPLITHRVSVDEAPKIFIKMLDDQSEILGVIFSWQ